MRWKEHVEHDHEMVDLLLRAATIVKDRLENPDRALKLLGDVRRLDPTSEAAAEKMRLIYAELEEWEKVAEVYLDQEGHVTGDERKAAGRAAAADVFMNRLKDRPRAIQHYERALQLNPQLKDVALSLARAYVATEKWEKAEPLLDMLLAYPDVASDPARAAEIHFQIGLCAERLLDHDRAFREYQTAVKARPDHGPTILGLARLYQRRQLWQLSKDHFVKAIDIGGEELTEADVAAAQFSLGEVSLELNELDDAISYLDQVAEGSANRPKAVQILIQIAERKGDWASVVQYKQALLASKRDPFEKFAIMIEVGDIYRTKMRNFYGATQAYKEALELKKGERAVLMRLFELYLESGAIEDALYQLEQLAQAEESPEKRALQYVRMAALYQEKLGDDTRAIEHLNLALDADPDRLEAFRAIDEILTARKDWEAQAENYRRMLERLRGRNAPELEYRLYANLGEIYRSRMKQMDYAIAAYSAAAKLKPEERRTHEILAQLYELAGDQLDRAVEEHRAIINAAPLSAEAAVSYKSMRRLFLDMKDFDKAFVTSGVLVALGQADPPEVEFFEGNLEPGLPWFKGTIDSLRWESHLMSKTENATLGRVLQTLYQGLGSELGAKDLKDIGLKKKDELDLEQKLLFVNVYKAVSKALGPLPHRVYRDPSPVGLKVEFLAPPAFVAGSDMLTGHEEREAAFLIGRQLTFLHPMHFLAAVKNRSELMVFIAAVLKFCKPDTPITTGAEFISEVVRLIERRMPQQQKNHLAKLVEDLAARYPGMDFQSMFEDFFRSVERTALRAGTLVSGNVDIVLTHLKSEEVSFSGMPQRDRLEEVVRFAVSDDHFVLRRALGIAIEGTGA
ncbi:MAG: tetratricopeptide repeat protein [Deltaproteobacteria bacterium]|nr:tetratricopeptide repeat protein [Deltaproteobacteria bacterium]